MKVSQTVLKADHNDGDVPWAFDEVEVKDKTEFIGRRLLGFYTGLTNIYS